MLNRFWGKFGQRENLPQVEQCTTPQELYNITEDDTNQVQELRFCSEDVHDLLGAAQALLVSGEVGRATCGNHHRDKPQSLSS